MIFTCIGFNFIRTSKEKQKVILQNHKLLVWELGKTASLFIIGSFSPRGGGVVVESVEICNL